MAQHFSASHNTNSLPTTAKLMKLLETSPNQFRDRHLNEIKSISFHEYLSRLMEEKHVSVSHLISGACISKTYVYQFVSGERLPGRDIVLRMALAMRLNINDTQRLLTLAGKGILYPKIRRDAGILFCFRKKMSLDEANSFLEDIGEVPLL